MRIYSLSTLKTVCAWQRAISYERSVSNGTPWDTRRPPRGNFSLTKHRGFCLVDHISHYLHTKVNSEDMECSTSRDSDKGSCTEAPQIGVTVREPVEQGADKTPLTEGGTPVSQ